MSQYPYAPFYTPPVPILQVTLHLPETGASSDPFAAIVDTGADATLVPLSFLDALGVHPWGEATLRSQWGERRHIYTYLIDLQIGEETLPAIEVVGDDVGQEIILGRTLLNKLILLLDGPQSILHILSQRPRHLR